MNENPVLIYDTDKSGREYTLLLFGYEPWITFPFNISISPSSKVRSVFVNFASVSLKI